MTVKSTSPRLLATYMSIIISVLSGMVIGLNILVQADKIIFLVFSVLLLFIFNFILIYYVLNKFIIRKIKPIYKTINSLKMPEKELYSNIDHIDIIGDLNTEVTLWATNKINEIKQLKENEKFRKEFIGNVAHELKTPIFNIQGYILTLLDGALDDRRILKKYLKRTEKNLNRLIALIKDVDTISRLEGGMLKLNFESFNVVQLIEEVMEMQEMRKKKYGVELDFVGELKSDTIIVNADKEKIFEVLNNLVVNSFKYGKPGGKTQIRVSEKKDKALIDVIDNGIGIEKKNIPRLFERFYRVDKSRSREQGGTGLGLAIVKHIIEAHKQSISVESTPNEGSTFTFTLQKTENEVY